MSSEDIPSKHKAAVYDNPGQVSIKIDEIDTPQPGAGEVLVRLTHSGVCHSDMGVMCNSWAILPYPTQAGQVGGHEGVGKIVKMGAGTENSGVKEGQRVGIKWISAVCNSCEACLTGHDGVCFNQKISGYYTPGTFQQYVTAPATYVTPIPDGVDSAEAAPMLCAGVTVLSALRKTGCKGGDFVVIPGAGGGLGHLACQIASRDMGLRVIGIDHPSKKELATKSGAEHFIDFTSSKDVVEDVKNLTDGLGAHAVVVLTASNAAYANAIPMLRFAGTLVCVGVPEGDLQPIKGAAPGPLLQKEQKIVGSAVGNRKEAIDTLNLVKRGIIHTHFKTCKMEELADVFHKMDRGEIQGRYVLEID